MSKHNITALRDLIDLVLVRYLTVKPGGFELEQGRPLRPAVEARVLSCGGARTLYENRKPVCRSLNGVVPLEGDGKLTCADCPKRARCTPQVRLDLVVEQRPYRLLLAYTSARAFLLYESRLRLRRLAIEEVVTSITVLNRGSWGELRFAQRD